MNTKPCNKAFKDAADTAIKLPVNKRQQQQQQQACPIQHVKDAQARNQQPQM